MRLVRDRRGVYLSGAQDPCGQQLLRYRLRVDPDSNRVVIIAAIDNLVKRANALSSGDERDVVDEAGTSSPGCTGIDLLLLKRKAVPEDTTAGAQLILAIADEVGQRLYGPVLKQRFSDVSLVQVVATCRSTIWSSSSVC